MAKAIPRASRPHTARGRWWRPDDPSEVIPGVLSYRPGQPTKLLLDGVFGEQATAALFMTREELPVIHGETSTGDLITLFDTFKTGSSVANPGYSTSECLAHMALVGTEHVGSQNASAFRVVDLHFSHIEAWFSKSPLSVAQNPMERKIACTGTDLEGVEFSIAEIGGTLSLVSTIQTKWSRTRTSLKHKVTFRIVLVELRSIESLMPVIRDIQNMLSLFVGEPVQLNEAILRCQNTNGVIDFSRPSENHLLVGDKHDALPQRTMFWTDMLLPCGACGVEELQWFCSQYFHALKLFDRALGLLIGIQSGTFRFVQNRLLTLTQALEALSRLIDDEDTFYVPQLDYCDVYSAMVNAIPSGTNHRLRESLKKKLQYGNEVSLRQRLVLLSKRIPLPLHHLLANTLPEFGAKVAKVRNALTHNNWAEVKEPTNTEYFEMNLRLELIIVCAVLRMIGVAPNIVADRIPMIRRFKELGMRTSLKR